MADGRTLKVLGISGSLRKGSYNTAALRALRASIECVVIAPDGVRVGVHRPGTAADAGVCGA